MVIGQHIDMFENLFQAMGASLSPLYCITPIVDGEPLVEVIEYKNFLEAHRPTRIESHQIAPSYLTSYMTPDGFDFPKLFNDDFFLAIRLSYNHRHYISCMKLLVSFIDTVAFLEFGDVQRNFQTFLEKYADLQHLTITSDELWEFRNSLLHMTNNESRKVKKGSTRKLLFYVGELPKSFPMEIDGIGYFGLMDLIKTFAKAVEAWITDLNNDRSKYPLLFDRYDSILSDVRFDMLKFESLPIQA